MIVVGTNTVNELGTLLEDVENYIDQAQILVSEAAERDRKGASILHRMGGDVLQRVRVEQDTWIG